MCVLAMFILCHKEQHSPGLQWTACCRRLQQRQRRRTGMADGCSNTKI